MKARGPLGTEVCRAICGRVPGAEEPLPPVLQERETPAGYTQVGEDCHLNSCFCFRWVFPVLLLQWQLVTEEVCLNIVYCQQTVWLRVKPIHKGCLKAG